ncbi:TPA: restriction endonuclease subunit S [Vibrio parahaemolyticus]|nr:restriction endonuclease subunit S [Vibrio parahaemolyticus]ELY5143099.1 restriction endonuclease subunit S [Vibrio vulnificus]HBC3956467.1 restriction endonuclease subunit S [Vibrio parahaemolyticus]
MAYETDKFAFGKLPSGWRCVPLGDLIKSTEYGSSAKSHYSGTIPVLRMGNLQEGKIDWGDLVYTSDENEIKRYRLRSGDVLFNRTNTVDLVGKAAIYKGSRPAIFAGYLIRIIHNETLVDSNYLNYVLNTYQAKKYSKAVLSVAVSQANINAEKLKTYPIPLPPTLEEQAAIANALSDVDALISELEKLIAKKQAVKTATMQQLLTGKQRLPQFAKYSDGMLKGYKKSELGEIPEDWDIGSVGDRSVSYSGGTPSTSNKSFYGGNISWITSSDLNKSFIYEVEGRITEAGLQGSSAKLVDAGTFLIALYGATAGVCAITKIKAAINQAVLAVASSLWSPEFLFYWFTNNKNKLIETYTQGGQPNLSGDIVRSIRMSIPPMREQKEIVSVLSDMDDELQALEKRLKKTRQIKQGMMQELLTGKTRLVKPESK